MPSKDPLILEIDLGGTKILTSVINPEGEMLSRDHSVTPAGEGPGRGDSGHSRLG